MPTLPNLCRTIVHAVVRLSFTYVASPTSSTRIISYIDGQYARAVPNVDIVGSSKCQTRHLTTGGVARFNYVLGTNSNPVTTCASDERVNPYPNNVTCPCKIQIPHRYFDTSIHDAPTSNWCVNLDADVRYATCHDDVCI